MVPPQSLPTVPPSFSPVLSPASPQAHALCDLFVATSVVCAAIFLLVAALVGWCLIRFRTAPSSALPRQVEGNATLEVTWTLATTLVLVLLFILTVGAMRIADPAPKGRAEVVVVAHQWWWEVRYADGFTSANEIDIPTGADVLLRVEAADVVHSFWVPQLARKVDAIPGHPNHVWLRADEAGRYLGGCSEFCGAQHAWMRLLVVAREPEQHRAWISRQLSLERGPTTAAAARGERAFREKTCVNCHSIHLDQSVRVGPDLSHFASRETLGAGVLENTDDGVRRWLTDPQKIKPGCRMPNFHLTSREVQDLAAFLGTLQ